MSKKVLENRDVFQDLDELSVDEVFNRCLDSYNIDDEERTLLNRLYGEIVSATLEEDINL
jgi:exonuclease SbcD